jgi:hypothetical protein
MALFGHSQPKTKPHLTQTLYNTQQILTEAR